MRIVVRSVMPLVSIFLIALCQVVGVSASDQSSGINFSTIKQSAILSAASYSNVPTQGVAGTDFKPVEQIVLPVTAVSYFFARNATTQALSFRGTSNLENVLVDLDVSLKSDAHSGILLHQGFAAAAWDAYQNVKPKLDASQPIITTGHSLGGAIAVIVAMYLQKDGFNVSQVITFGQPKVTNVAGAGAYASLPLTRVVTPKDIVPLVPPLSPLQLQNLDIYWHMGQEVILMAERKYALTSGLKSMMRATKFVSSVPDETNLHAHQMATYLQLINSNLQFAEEVPYKMEINLFGFSLD